MDERDKTIDNTIESLGRAINRLEIENESLIALRDERAEPLPDYEGILEDPNTGKKWRI
jgi:hypothetical protein